MDTKFTPGPWKECRNGDCTCGHVWSIPGDFPVCTVQVPREPIAVAHENMADAPDIIYQSITPEMCAANARLIAAAPDLHDSIRDLLAYLDGDISGPAQRDGIIAEARAALAKVQP